MNEVGVNLGFLFTALPLTDRFGAAVDAGFRLVELPWPGDAAEQVPRVAARAGAQIVLLNVATGDFGSGERGFAHLPEARVRWRHAFQTALRVAEEAGARRLNVLAGTADPVRTRDEQLDCLAANLDWAAGQVDGTGVSLVIEQLNAVENPGYLLSDPDQLRGFLDRFGGAVQAQLDVHHLYASGADLPTTAARFTGVIGHVQVSDQPGRVAPGSGTLDWSRTLSSFSGAGYTGPWMLEYRAEAGTQAAGVRQAGAVLRRAQLATTSGGGP